jgi:hypothetical protein
LREKLVAEGSLVDGGDPTLLVFAEDVAFNSPSAAASVIMARASNGRKNWKVTGTSTTYGEWQDAKLAEIVAPEQLETDEGRSAREQGGRRLRCTSSSCYAQPGGVRRPHLGQLGWRRRCAPVRFGLMPEGLQYGGTY